MIKNFTPHRRAFLGLLASAAAVAAAGHASSQQVKTSARIVIIGAGAAGISLANRLLEKLDGAAIIVIDASQTQVYQPGLTLVGAGLKPASYTVSKTTKWLNKDVTLIQENAALIDPFSKAVVTTTGNRVAYDFLVVATGLYLDYASIEGFSLDLIGKKGVGSVYAGPDYAAATWEAASKFIETGGTGVFTRPNTEMKCSGAPLKHTFLIDDLASHGPAAGRFNIKYMANNQALFSVPIVHERVRMLFESRSIAINYEHVLKAIDADRRKATFVTPKGPVEVEYDYIHVIPPQRAPAVVRNSPLPWADKWVDQGWVEVNPQTLRHPRFPDIFAIGDVAGVPKGKTAASVKWQLPVIEDHLMAALQGKDGTLLYHGYTSCPMITRVGRAMLIEFDYKNNLVPSFPGIIPPLEELWITWLIKEIGLKATYSAMLRGRA